MRKFIGASYCSLLTWRKNLSPCTANEAISPYRVCFSDIIMYLKRCLLNLPPPSTPMTHQKKFKLAETGGGGACSFFFTVRPNQPPTRTQIIHQRLVISYSSLTLLLKLNCTARRNIRFLLDPDETKNINRHGCHRATPMRNLHALNANKIVGCSLASEADHYTFIPSPQYLPPFQQKAFFLFIHSLPLG